MIDPVQRAALHELFERYARAVPAEAESARAFGRFLHAHPHCCERTLALGHFTGSAWLVDTTGSRVLLTHHRKLGRWLQLGGHADGDPDLAGVALREAGEESGLAGLRVERAVFDLDRHWIPERADDPGHWHYDLRFVVHATQDDRFVVSDESHALEWRGVDGLAEDPGLDESLRRMARRWLARVRA